MNDHKIRYTYVPANETRSDGHFARCLACGDTSGQMSTKQMTEDWGNKHRDKMERLRQTIRGHGTPEGDLRYYREMAAKTELDPLLRAQWQGLADSLNRRLHGVDHRYSEDVPLL